MAGTLKPGTKALMHNGKKVADVEMTGDLHADADKCREVLKGLGLHVPTTKVQAMHKQAHGFAICAVRIHDNLLQQERSYAGVAPFVVNAAFALEVYLKALTERFGGQFKGIHKLEELLGNLPQEAQSAVQWQIPFVMSLQELRLGYDLTAIMRDLNTAFVDWRYMYEDKKLTVQIPEVLYALRLLHAASHNSIIATFDETAHPI